MARPRTPTAADWEALELELETLALDLRDAARKRGVVATLEDCTPLYATLCIDGVDVAVERVGSRYEVFAYDATLEQTTLARGRPLELLRTTWAALRIFQREHSQLSLPRAA